MRNGIVDQYIQYQLVGIEGSIVTLATFGVCLESLHSIERIVIQCRDKCGFRPLASENS